MVKVQKARTMPGLVLKKSTKHLADAAAAIDTSSETFLAPSDYTIVTADITKQVDYMLMLI